MPPNALVTLRQPPAGFVIVGGGKTAIDTVIWLLEQGTDPDRITWIRPRDAWLMNRRTVQISDEFFESTIGGLALEMECARDASSVDDLFARLEAADMLRRIDPQVTPTMFRCAIVSDAELAQLRRVTRVVRMGHVTSIEPGRILLEGGELPITPQQVIVHCSADGIPRMPARPIFQGPRIKLQYVRQCQPTFSGAFVAHVQATSGSDDEKNALCTPVPIPDAPADWLAMHLAAAQNSYRWSKSPELQKWLYGSRLDGFAAMFAHASRQGAPDKLAIIDRYLKAIRPGTTQLARLMAVAG